METIHGSSHAHLWLATEFAISAKMTWKMQENIQGLYLEGHNLFLLEYFLNSLWKILLGLAGGKAKYQLT